MGRHTTSTAALAVLVALGVGACSAGDNDSASMSSTDSISPADTISPAEQLGGAGQERASGDASVGQPAGAGEAGEMAAGATGGSTSPSAPLDLDGLGRSIAVVAGVTFGTANVRQAVDDTLTVVRRNGASVYSADVNIGDEHDDGSIDGSGRIVVKVPPAGLDALIADLDGTAGTLIGRTQSSEDVTDQLVDLDIRIEVERTTIKQFEALLAAATGFDDIVTIQRTISEHTVTLEQLLASQRNVEQRVDLSTLTIDLTYQPIPVTVDQPVEPGDDGLRDAFASGWDVFTGVLFAIALVLAVAAPFLLILIVIAGAAWLFGRRRGGTHGGNPQRPASSASSASSPSFAPAGSATAPEDEVLVGPNHER